MTRGDLVEEKEMINQCIKGKMSAYAGLISNYEVPLYRYCYHLMNNEADAQDLFQDCWVKVMEKIHQYKFEFSFKNWLFAIASNTFKDYYRKRQRLYEKQESFYDNEHMIKRLEGIESGHNIEQTYLEGESHVELQRALMKLKWHYRIVLILFYFQEASIKDIGKILSLPEGTVKSRLSQGKKLLKKLMEVGE